MWGWQELGGEEGERKRGTFLKRLPTQAGGQLPQSPTPVPATAPVCHGPELSVQLEVCRRGEGPTVQNVHLIKVENMV